MNLKSSVSINWEAAGAELAALSDNEQSEFFKGFFAELKTWNSFAKVEMQMEYIRVKLSDEDKKLAIAYLSQLVFNPNE